MCGLAGFFARESVPPIKVIDTLFTNAENRGTDGFGCVVVRSGKLVRYSSVKPYSECRQEALEFVEDNLCLGDLLLAICRAAPETEPPTTIRNMQPIINHDCVLIHNGSISNKIYKQIKEESIEKFGKFSYTTDIDSEAILHAYALEGRNMKNAMERISGGVAAVVYDSKQDCLYTINDFKPLAHGYIRGVGYFLSSDNECLGEIIEQMTDCSRNGISIWEDFYNHYLSGGFIRRVDLDSGFMRKIQYSPRYITQQWDSNKNENKL